MGRATHLVIHNLPVSFHQGLRIEWSFSVEHFIHADPQAPPVTLGPVTTLAVLHGPEDLGADVVRGPHGDVALDGAVLGKSEAGAKVGKADVAGGVDQHVVRLDVTVDVSQVVD